MKYGHVKISRKAYATDPLWLEEREFSRWEAWEWFIQAAAWEPVTRTVGGVVVELKRGEVLASLRFLSDAWGWGHKKVRVFISLLLKTGRVRAQRETQAGTVFILVKYDSYQGDAEQEGTPKKRKSDRRKASVTIGAHLNGSLSHEVPKKGHTGGTANGTVDNSASTGERATYETAGTVEGTQEERKRAVRGHTEGTPRAQIKAVKQLSSKAISSKSAGAGTDQPTDVELEQDVDAIIDHANRGAREALGETARPIPRDHASRSAVRLWVTQLGVPADFAALVVYERARAYRPSGNHRRISTMEYFAAAVADESAKLRAGSVPDFTLSGIIPVDRARRKSDVEEWRDAHPEEYAQLEADAIAWMDGHPTLSRASEGVRRTQLETEMREAVRRRIAGSVGAAL